MYSSAGFQLVSQASLALFDLNIFLHFIKKKKKSRPVVVERDALLHLKLLLLIISLLSS